MMTFTEAMELAYEHQLSVDFWSCTIIDPDGNEYYWQGGCSTSKEYLIGLVQHVVKERTDGKYSV